MMVMVVGVMSMVSMMSPLRMFASRHFKIQQLPSRHFPPASTPKIQLLLLLLWLLLIDDIDLEITGCHLLLLLMALLGGTLPFCSFVLLF